MFGHSCKGAGVHVLGGAEGGVILDAENGCVGQIGGGGGGCGGGGGWRVGRSGSKEG